MYIVELELDKKRCDNCKSRYWSISNYISIFRKISFDLSHLDFNKGLDDQGTHTKWKRLIIHMFV